MNVCIFGLGQQGRRYFSVVKPMEKKLDISIKSFLTSEGNSSAIGLARNNGIKVWTDVREVLDDRGLDGVIICTPNRFHAKQTLDFALAGKHILCEKPLCYSSREAREIAEVSRRSGVSIQVGMNCRFREQNRALRARLREIGRVSHFVGWYYYNLTRSIVNDEKPWIKEEPCREFFLYGGGIHLVDLSVWFFGRPNWVFASATDNMLKGKVGNDFYSVEFGYSDNNMRGHLFICKSAIVENRFFFDVFGTKGSIVQSKIITLEKNGGVSEEELKFSQEYPDLYYEVADWRESIRQNRPPENSVSSALVNTAILESIEKSIDKQTVIPIEYGEVDA